jgi:hypothetical protein
MNCHRPFNHDAMVNLFGSSFVKSVWKEHRQNVLLDRETAMLPETQPFVEQELQQRENKKRVRELEQEKARLKRQARDIDRTIYDIQHTRVDAPSAERREFIQKCARNGCDGFLNNTWRCRKCAGDSCRDCGAFKGDDATLHVCKEEDKASMELIRNDSRRCVACGAWTYKIHGCNQMYCVAPGCNTAWDWRTGKTVVGAIHNPEYFRMRRELNLLGRDMNDIPCGGAPSMHEISSIWKRDTQQYTKAFGLLRVMTHIQGEELARYPALVVALDNRDLRIQYFLSEISQRDFKIRLQQREKKTNKNREINMMLNMFVTTVSDLLRQAVLCPTFFNARHDEIVRLIYYFNGEMSSLAKRYQCVVPSIYPATYNGGAAASVDSGYWRVIAHHNPLGLLPLPLVARINSEL